MPLGVVCIRKLDGELKSALLQPRLDGVGQGYAPGQAKFGFLVIIAVLVAGTAESVAIFLMVDAQYFIGDAEIEVIFLARARIVLGDIQIAPVSVDPHGVPGMHLVFYPRGLQPDGLGK